VTFSAGVQYLRVDPAAIIANQNLQLVRGIFQFQFDAARLGVPERIYQGLACDTVHLISDHWVQGTGLPFRNDSIIN
jgi:hypothetical protein